MEPTNVTVNNKHILLEGSTALLKNFTFWICFFPPFFPSLSSILAFPLQPYFSSYQISFSVASSHTLQKIKCCLEFIAHFVSFIYNFVNLENYQLSGLRVAYYEITSLKRFLQRMLGTALLKCALLRISSA